MLTEGQDRTSQLLQVLKLVSSMGCRSVCQMSGTTLHPLPVGLPPQQELRDPQVCLTCQGAGLSARRCRRDSFPRLLDMLLLEAKSKTWKPAWPFALCKHSRTGKMPGHAMLGRQGGREGGGLWITPALGCGFAISIFPALWVEQVHCRPQSSETQDLCLWWSPQPVFIRAGSAWLPAPFTRQ